MILQTQSKQFLIKPPSFVKEQILVYVIIVDSRSCQLYDV